MDRNSGVRCAQCGTAIPERPGLPEAERMSCLECGSTSRQFTKTAAETLPVHDFLDVRRKDASFPSGRKLRVHVQVGDEVDHKTGRWVLKQRRIDKGASPAWYFERIAGPIAGGFMHECSEPLTKHTEHGSAKRPRKLLAEDMPTEKEAE